MAQSNNKVENALIISVLNKSIHHLYVYSEKIVQQRVTKHIKTLSNLR